MTMVASFTVFFSYYNIMKHYSFMTYMLDLGINIQMLFITINGEILNFVVWLRPIMYLILPFYALMPRAELLLTIQPLIVALGAFPLYLLARDELANRGAGLCFAALYLLYPPIHGLTSFDFHVHAFIPLFVLFALYFYKKQVYSKCVFFIIMAVMTIEYVYPVILFLGIYFLVTRQYRVLKFVRSGKVNIRVIGNVRIILTTLTISCIMTLYFFFIRSRFFYDFSQAFFSGFITTSFQDKFNYVIKLFGPLGFSPLLSPLELLPSLPWFMYSFWSAEREYVMIYNQYSAFVAPFIFFASIKGIKAIISDNKARILLRVFVFLFISIVLFNFTSSPLLISPALTKPWPTIGEREIVLSNLVSSIPQNASVLTQNNIAPHLANRYGLFSSPAHLKGPVDYILVDTKNPFFMNGPPNPPVGVGLQKVLEKWSYTVVFEYDGIFLYKRI
ncbi:MAG: DUF2079 domain-containing protein [Candidatus Geothermarchaeales archaeon]